MTGVSQIHVHPELDELFRDIQATTNHDIATIRENLSSDYFQEDEAAFESHLLSFRTAALAADQPFAMAYDIYFFFRDLIIKNLPCSDEALSINSAGVQLVLLPPEIGLLFNLVEINLRVNRLLALPVDIRKLVHLEKLILVDNKIQSLPTCLFEMPQLKVILSDHQEENDEAFLKLRANSA